MSFLTYLAITSVLFFEETNGEELLLSALKRDIEENVMERVIKYFSKYDEKIQKIDTTIAEITDALTKATKDITVLQIKDIELQGKIDALEKANKARPAQISQERISKIEEITKTLALRSCQEYKEFGITTPGVYYIDPDGRWGKGAPFQVLCNFEYGITEIMHDQEDKIEIPHCPDEMCYQLSLGYPTTKEQLTSLIDLSATCTQQIQFDCYLAPLYMNNKPVGAWLNREGKDEFYFAGSHHGYHVCDCGINASCSNTEGVHYCNCDSKKPEYQIDSGIITNMSALPITGFKYGNFQFPSQTASISVGSLKCSGIKPIQLNEVYSSCQNLKRYGMTNPGNYIMNDGSVVFCNMVKHISDPELQTHIEKLLFKDVM